MSKRVKIQKYENLVTGDVYYGYPLDECLTKEIEGQKYIEVVTSLQHPKQLWIKADSIKKLESTFHVFK